LFQAGCRACSIAQPAFGKPRTLGLTGFARNLADGRVEVLACGDEAAVNEFIEWLWEGSPASKVTDVATERADPARLSVRRLHFRVTLADLAQVVRTVPARPLVDDFIRIPALPVAAVVARQCACDVVLFALEVGTQMAQPIRIFPAPSPADDAACRGSPARTA
jgi:acylphosphatase